MGIIKEKDRFKQLTNALEAGWEIDQPVLLGAMWQTEGDDRRGVYHFVLRKKCEDQTTIISLPPSSKLFLFIAENNLQIKTHY